MQETALRALLNLHRFRGDAQIYTWLYSIVNNSAIDRLRSPQRRRSVSLETELQSADHFLIHNNDSPRTNPEQLCAEGEMYTILHGEVEQLQPKYRSAIELCDIDERSYDDVAKFLNISISTVKSRLYRGRRLLRQRVHRRVFTRPPLRPCKSPPELSDI
jgi:RNA polymerase sigma-70 factor, ECF subfamily